MSGSSEISFPIEDSLDALWYFFSWAECKSAYDVRPDKTKKKPNPQDLPPPPRMTEVALIESDEVDTTPTDPIFALTIGIDKYANSDASLYGRKDHDITDTIVTNLSGCVADADNVVEFLVKTLHVPNERITNLRNEGATAAGITSALELFASNKAIPKDAIIFIFYAGHGAEAEPPTNYPFPFDGKIQTLVPYDFEIDLPVSSDADPIAKNGLADFKLNKLLENIAKEKGNRITVIFDSCHSGSGTRQSGGKKTNFLARGIQLPRGTRLDSGALPATTSRAATISDKNKHKGLGSHVLFAACTELQSAYESNGQGMFTSALLNLLKSDDLAQLTHSDIIQRLPQLPGQNPRCECLDQNLIFLHQRTASHRRPSYKLTRDSDGHHLIDAGEAYGVTANAEFTLYTSDRTKELGRLVVSNARAFQSTLVPIQDGQTFDTSQTDVVAIQTRLGTAPDVCLCIESSAELSAVFTATAQIMHAKSPWKPSFRVVSKRSENPHLIITAKEGVIHFEIMDKFCRDAGLCEIAHYPATDSASMSKILRGVANFYWYLNHKTTGKGILSPKIGFACFELVENDVMEPTDHNLFADGVQIRVDVSDDSKAYGFRLHNRSEFPLYVSMFYFNMSDLSISSYYQPPPARLRDKDRAHSLRPGEYLTIGYGASISQPVTYYLNEGQKIDVGYLKLFLSGEYVDYSSIPQESPFLPECRITGPYQRKHQPWDTMCIPIIQRRAEFN